MADSSSVRINPYGLRKTRGSVKITKVIFEN